MEMAKISLLTTFLFALIALSTQNKHLLLALMCLEMMMLILFTMLVVFTSTAMTMMQIPMMTIMITISVCGAATGLSLVVATTRTRGSDFMNNLNLL